MLKIIRESFGITNKYIVYLATPLVLFSFLSSLYLVFSSNSGKIGLIFAVILFLLMLAAFTAGWLYMVSNCVKNKDLEDKLSLIVEFPSGVGEFFLPALGILFNLLLICGLIYFGAHVFGMHYIGDIGITAEALKNAQTSPEAAKQLFESLSPEQIVRIGKWSLLSFVVGLFCSFMFMFYSPAVIYKTKNPFKAIFVALKDLFSHRFFKNVLLFIILFTSYTVLAIIGGLLNFNLFLQFVVNLVSFYYAVFVAVFIYNYYYSNFVKIGSNIDVNV